MSEPFGDGGWPKVLNASVVDSRLLGVYRALILHAPDIAYAIGPGQFLNVAVEGRLLRRPFTVYLANWQSGTVSIAFDAIGEGTRWLAAREAGDIVNVVGPLGRGFKVPDEARRVLLVGGGYGTAALSMLAAAIDERGGQAHAILGARTSERVFRDEMLDATCASIAIVTDDGSAGARGLVTDPMPRLIERVSPSAVYACGPMPMLEAVARVAAEHRLAAYLATEEFMACGLGVCWTCVVPVNVDGAVRHLRACTEGPVFDGEVVAWASI